MRPKRVKRVGKKDILTVLWLLEHPKPSSYMTTRTRYLDIFICLTWLIWRALGQKHIFVILFPIIFLFSLRLSGRAFDWDYFLCEMWERKLSFPSVVLLVLTFLSMQYSKDSHLDEKDTVVTLTGDSLVA